MELLLVNGKIGVMDKENNFAEAIGIENGKISFVGSNGNAEKYLNKANKIIDLQGKLVLPGFNDSHMHLLSYGLGKKSASLEEAESIDDVVRIGKKFIMKNHIKENQWFLGRGWNQDYFYNKNLVTKDDLDKISKEHYICFTRVCGHIATVNSKALNYILNQNPNEKNNPNIDLEKGIFKEDAIRLINNSMKGYSVKGIKEMILDASKDLLKCGITSIQSDDFEALPNTNFEDILKAFEELREEKKLKVRINQQCLLPTKKKIEKFLSLGYRSGDGDEFFRIGPLKLLLDGSLGARTAMIKDGYRDDIGNYGIQVYKDEEFYSLIKTAHDNNMQLAVHAIGDGAIELTVDTINKVLEENPKENHRHGVVHCQISNEKLLNKIKENDLITYIQPIFIDYDMHIIESRVGLEYSKNTYAWKSMMNRGIIPCGGSDAPVVSFNVMKNLYSAVTRKDLKGYPKEGWLTKEKLTVKEAIKLFTVNSSYASFEEDIKGTLEVGKLADMVILSEDITSIDGDLIKEVQILTTIVNGEIVYNMEKLS